MKTTRSGDQDHRHQAHLFLSGLFLLVITTPLCGGYVAITGGGGTASGAGVTAHISLGQPLIGLSAAPGVILRLGIEYESTRCNTADITDQSGSGSSDGRLTPSDVVTFFAEFFNSTGCPGTGPCNKADLVDVSGFGPPDGKLTASDVVLFFTAFFNAPCAN